MLISTFSSEKLKKFQVERGKKKIQNTKDEPNSFMDYLIQSSLPHLKRASTAQKPSVHPANKICRYTLHSKKSITDLFEWMWLKESVKKRALKNNLIKWDRNLSEAHCLICQMNSGLNEKRWKVFKENKGQTQSWWATGGGTNEKAGHPWWRMDKHTFTKQHTLTCWRTPRGPKTHGWPSEARQYN